MSTRDPLADRYLADLRRAATRLPRAQRRELVAEVSAHGAAGVSAARSEADVRNMLDDLGDPADIVGAAAPPAEVGSSGILAGVLGVLQVILILWQPIGVALGDRCCNHWCSRTPLSPSARPTQRDRGVVLGAIAIVVPILVFGLLVSLRTSETEDNPTVEVEATPTSLGG